MGEKDDSFFVSIWPLAKEAHAGESLGWEGMPEGQENRWKGEMDDMQKVLDMEKLIQLVADKQFRVLKEILSIMNEADVAAFLQELPMDQMTMVFRTLPKELAADVFADLDVDEQEHIITKITDRELKNIIEELYVDDAVDMLEELPANLVKRILQNASPGTRNLINQFLNYPENSAGSIMTAEYVGLKKTMTVEQAFAYIRRHGVDKETIYTCYVMDAKRDLEGVVTVKDLLMNPYEATRRWSPTGSGSTIFSLFPWLTARTGWWVS